MRIKVSLIHAAGLLLAFVGLGQDAPAQPPEHPDPATVSGTVRDAETGRPVAQVTVACRFRVGDESTAMRAVTDAAGRYTIAAPAREPVALSFVKDGHARTFTGPFVPGTRPWFTGDVALEREAEDVRPEQGCLTGVVLNAATGRPVRGVKVHLSLAGGGSKARARTDGQGRFRFDAKAGDREGRRVEIRHRGFREYVSEVVPFDPGRTTHIVVFVGSARTLLRGAVQDRATGAPLIGARVEFRPDIAGPTSRSVNARPSGYVLEAAPGHHRVRASAPGYAPDEEWVDIKSGETRVLDFALRKIDSFLKGTCIHARTGRPLAGVKVDAFTDEWPEHVARTDAAGGFFTRLPAREYRILASKEGYRPEFIDRVPVGPDGKNDALLRLTPIAGSLSGRVVNRDTGRPPERHIEVDVACVDPHFERWVGPILDYPTVEIDRKAGTYRTEAGPGRFRIEVRSPGYFPFEKIVNLPDQEHRTFDVALIPFPPRTATIRGMLSTEPRVTLDHWGVSTFLGTTGLGWVKAEADGSFEAKVPAGRVRLQAMGQRKQGKRWITFHAAVEVETSKGSVTEIRMVMRPKS